MVKPNTKSVQKRGRPPLAPEQKKRGNVTIRMRDSMKAKLQTAGAAEGRSLSEEIESRLERSFRINRDFGDESTYSLMVSLAGIKKHIEENTDQEGLTIDEKRSAILTVWRPLLKELFLSEDRDGRGKAFGERLIEKIRVAIAEVDIRSAEES